MRRAQKRQAEDFLKVLEEAHEEIRAAIENRNYSAEQLARLLGYDQLLIELRLKSFNQETAPRLQHR